MRNILYIQCIVKVNGRMGTRGNTKEVKDLKQNGWLDKRGYD